MRVKQEGDHSHWYESEDINHPESASSSQSLADLPLPAAALLVDVRRQTTHDYPLVWNVATEIEGLSAQMRLKRLTHWELLDDCLEFLHIGTEQVSRAPTRFTLTSRSDIRTFLSDEECLMYINEAHIERVRSNRRSAAVLQKKKPDDTPYLAAGPVQSVVRVFFLVDMENEETFEQAIHYASILKRHNLAYDDPDRTGRNERLSIFCICMNANPRQQGDLFERFPTFDTVFDSMILIQAYRNDDTFIGDTIQVYEVEQILYALLLASPGEFTNEYDAASDENMGRYLAYIEEQPTASSCSLYTIGVSSTEYSARSGKRWLSYGLAARLIELMRDREEIEYNDVHSQSSDVRQEMDKWWTHAQRLLPDALPVLLPPTQLFLTMPAFLMQRNQESPALATISQRMETFHQRVGAWYNSLTSQALQDAQESITYLPALLKKQQHERNRRNSETVTPRDKALLDFFTLLEQAQTFLISLFAGARGALPRALLQLDMLTAKFQKFQKDARRPPEIAVYREQFEQEFKTTWQEMAHTFRTWQLPLFGKVLRSIALLWMIGTGLALLLCLAVLFTFLWQPFTTLPFIIFPFWRFILFFTGIGLGLLVILIVLLGTMLVVRRQKKRLRVQQDMLMERLYGCVYTQYASLQQPLIARTALCLLEMTGLYSDKNETCACSKNLQALESALKDAHDEAVNEQERAFERLKLTLSMTQEGQPENMAWLNLNIHRDRLSWPRLSAAFQQLYQGFEEGDVFFDELAKRMIQQTALGTSRQTFLPESHAAIRSEQVNDREELRFLGSTLVAAMISAKVNGYNLALVEPQIQRYLKLQARSLQEPSIFTENVTSLEQTLKEFRSEQVFRGIAPSSTLEAYESFFRKQHKSLGKILSSWVEHYYQFDSDLHNMLKSQNIIVRLHHEHITSYEVITDLQDRYQLFGYQDASQEDAYGHFYLLFVPDAASEEFFASLDQVQLPHFQWIRFPDEEKLIYMHVYRTHFRRSRVLLSQ